MLRYVELFFTSLILFLLAKRLGTLEYGKTVKDFLYITMVPFLAVGVAQSTAKHYSKSSTQNEKDNVLLFPLFVYLLITPIALALGFFYLNNPAWLLISFVGILNLVRNYFIIFFRLRERNLHSNIAGIIYTIFFFGLFYFYCHSASDYFKINFIAVLVFLLVALSLSFGYIKSINLLHFKNYLQANFKLLFNDSIKIYLVSLINIFLINHGRLVFQYLLQPQELGVLQFYDNVANVATILISTFCLYYQANFIAAFHKDNAILKKMNTKFIKILGLILLASNIIILPICCLIIKKYFTQYTQSYFLVALMFNYRVILFSTYLVSLFLITINKELKFFLYIFVFAIVMWGCGNILHLIFKQDYLIQLCLYFVISIVSYLITYFFLWSNLNKKNNTK
jgi:O-antigen/teichoic acid export membrane protein